MLRLVGHAKDVSSAINEFRLSYHVDFGNVRAVAKLYLGSETPEDHAPALAEALYRALSNWGAGSRKAPTLRLPQQAAHKLADKDLHFKLCTFSRCGIDAFSLDAKRDRVFTRSTTFISFDAFDIELLDVLHTLAEALFLNNTNVTYPMKALLLITGLMPALDSQVRKGLKRAGMAGLSGTQLLLPKDTSKALGKRICGLPFYLGNCWQLSQDVLRYAIAQSDHPGLSTEPGRVFDVLLFMQQESRRAPILQFG